MNDQLKLPIKMPIITSVPWHSCYLAILSAYEECKPWIYSKFIQLKTLFEKNYSIDNSKDFKIDFLSLHADDRDICPWLWHKSQKLRKDIVKLFINESNTTFTSLIIKWINMNYYISIDLDDFYIPNTNSYNKYHIYHESLIYGYDVSNKKFFTCGFYKDSHFCFDEIDFEIVEDAFMSSYLGPQHNTPLRLLKFDNNAKFTFDLNTVKIHLYDYLNSINTQQKYSIYRNEKEWIYGISIYEKFKDVFLSKQKYDYLIRSCYILWNHKVYLMDLFNYINDNFSISNYDWCVKEYKYIESEVKKVLNRTIKYYLTNNEMLMNKNVQSIDIIKKTEYSALSVILNNITY